MIIVRPDSNQSDADWPKRTPDRLEDLRPAARSLAFNPDEARDDHGRWTTGGGGDVSEGVKNSKEQVAANKDTIAKAVAGLRSSGNKKFEVNRIPMDHPDAGNNDSYWTLAQFAQLGIPGHPYLVQGYVHTRDYGYERGDDVKVTLRPVDTEHPNG